MELRIARSGAHIVAYRDIWFLTPHRYLTYILVGMFAHKPVNFGVSVFRRAYVSSFADDRARPDPNQPPLRHGSWSTLGRRGPATFSLGESTRGDEHGGHCGLSRP